MKIKAPENAPENAPQGAPEVEAPETNEPSVLPREEAEKAFAARDKAKAEAREAKKQAADMAKRLAELEDKVEMGESESKAKFWEAKHQKAAQSWEAEKADLVGQLDAYKLRELHTSVLDEALRGTPPERRKAFELAYHGLISTGDLDGRPEDTEAAAKQTRKALAELFPEYFEPKKTAPATRGFVPPTRDDARKAQPPANLPRGVDSNFF